MSDEMIIEYCSPTLAGIKTGNLFTCNYDDKNQLILSYRVRDDNNNIVDKYVTVPIYSTDDLIAKGKQIVKYYGN